MALPPNVRDREFENFKEDSDGEVARRVCVSEGEILATPDGPIIFKKDGVNQVVCEDTVTPANNAPLPVKLTGVTGDVNITAGDLDVNLNHTGVSYDSTRIGDGTEIVDINTDNEMLVHDQDAHDKLDAVIAALGGSTGALENTFGSVSSVASSTVTTVVSFTVPVGKEFYLQVVEASGSNIAVFDVFKDAAQIARRRTYFGGAFNTEFLFVQTNNKGLKFVAGEVISLKVEHFRSAVGDFEGRILGVLE